MLDRIDIHIEVPRVAEVCKFCKLDETGDNLVRAATSCCA